MILTAAAAACVDCQGVLILRILIVGRAGGRSENMGGKSFFEETGLASIYAKIWWGSTLFPLPPPPVSTALSRGKR